MAKLYYPDISHWETVTNWDTVKNKCPFLITKATEGTTYVDAKLKSIVKKCEEKKIPYWLYTFLKPGNELEQAKFMVKTCKNIIGDYFVGYILDVEQKNSSYSVKKAFDYINSLGCKTMFYCMYADYNRYKDIIGKKPKNCAFWEARYGKNDGRYYTKYPPHKTAELHQFTENGTCPGISGKLDLNRITGTEKDEAWFCTSIEKESGKKPATHSKQHYTGEYPAFPDARQYYQQGDGKKTLKNYKTQIRRVQCLLNWALGTKLDDDGVYGYLTRDATKKLQKQCGLPVNGKFGNKCLAACKKMTR